MSTPSVKWNPKQAFLSWNIFFNFHNSSVNEKRLYLRTTTNVSNIAEEMVTVTVFTTPVCPVFSAKTNAWALLASVILVIVGHSSQFPQKPNITSSFFQRQAVQDHWKWSGHSPRQSGCDCGRTWWKHLQCESFWVQNLSERKFLRTSVGTFCRWLCWGPFIFQIKFQRAARTDKGVSAVGQVCSLMISILRLEYLKYFFFPNDHTF